MPAIIKLFIIFSKLIYNLFKFFYKVFFYLKVFIITILLISITSSFSEKKFIL